MPINPGRLDRRITFSALTVTRGGAGGVVESYEAIPAVPTVWAQKVEESSREFRAAAARHGEVTILFRIRWRDDITAAHRITYSGDTYEIVGPPVEENRREFLLLAAKLTEGRA